MKEWLIDNWLKIAVPALVVVACYAVGLWLRGVGRRLIAEKLQCDYVDREIIARVAELLNRKEEDVMEKEMPPGSLMGRIALALEHSPPIPSPTGMRATEPYLPAWEIPLDDTAYLAGLNLSSGNWPRVNRS